MTQFLEEEHRAEMAEKQRLLDEENARIEAERVAEELRLQELARAKEENPKALYAELMDFTKKMTDFFTASYYEAILEDDIPLKVGDIGKLVVVYQKDSASFSVIFGKRRSDTPAPKTIEEAWEFTRTNKMPSDVGAHKNIRIPEKATRL